MTKTELPRVYGDMVNEELEPMHEKDPTRLIDQAHELQQQIFDRGLKISTHERPVMDAKGTVYGISKTVTADLDHNTYVIVATSQSIPDAKEGWDYSSMHVSVLENGHSRWGLANEGSVQSVQAVNKQEEAIPTNSVDAVRTADELFAHATQLIQK